MTGESIQPGSTWSSSQRPSTMTTQNPQVGSMSTPQITMTRDLTQPGSRPMGRRNQLMDYGDAESYEFGMAASD